MEVIGPALCTITASAAEGFFELCGYRAVVHSTAALEALDQSVEEQYDAAEILARATLLAAGYHQHNRGERRKKRG
jgi:hypothetical protein